MKGMFCSRARTSTPYHAPGGASRLPLKDSPLGVARSFCQSPFIPLPINRASMAPTSALVVSSFPATTILPLSFELR